jgi:hypothetical protein
MRGLCFCLALTAGLGGCAASTSAPAARDAELSLAEDFIDAFYSFDALRLRRALVNAESSVPSMVYYQGWAEGGNYEVLERRPCIRKGVDQIECSITVRDDLIQALGVRYHVTDTFELSILDGAIRNVKTTSDDPPVFNEALDWVRQHHPDVVEGVCKGFFDGGPTPGDCVRAVVRGFAEFAAKGR